MCIRDSDNGPRAWPRNSDGSITDDAPCCDATRDSNGSTDEIVDAFDSTSDREEMLAPVARLLPDAGDTITGSIAHMRRRLKSPRRPDRPKWSRANPGRGRCPLSLIHISEPTRLLSIS